MAIRSTLHCVKILSSGGDTPLGGGQLHGRQLDPTADVRATKPGDRAATLADTSASAGSTCTPLRHPARYQHATHTTRGPNPFRPVAREGMAVLGGEWAAPRPPRWGAISLPSVVVLSPSRASPASMPTRKQTGVNKGLTGVSQSHASACLGLAGTRAGVSVLTVFCFLLLLSWSVSRLGGRVVG